MAQCAQDEQQTCRQRATCCEERKLRIQRVGSPRIPGAVAERAEVGVWRKWVWG